MDKIQLSDLTPDPRNLNLGSERGTDLIESSIAELGTGRSVLVDRNGYIIAGNHAVAAAQKLGIAEGVVVKTRGEQLVVVQREDLDLSTDPRARKLAIYDNRTTDLNLVWDLEALSELVGEIDLSEAFTEADLSYLIDGVLPDADDILDEAEEEPDEPEDNPDRAIVPIALTWLEKKQWESVKDHLGIQRDKQAFMRLVEIYGAEKMGKPG